MLMKVPAHGVTVIGKLVIMCKVLEKDLTWWGFYLLIVCLKSSG